MKFLLLAALVSLAAHAETAPPALTDGQVAKVLVTLDKGELAAAKIALKRAQGDEARNFAKRMKMDHTRNLYDTEDLAKKNKISLQASKLSSDISKDARAANQEVKSAADADFDRAYFKEQVTLHQKALDTLQTQLIPAAQSPALKQHLEATSKVVAKHLKLAQSALGG